ncbi:MAG: membrane protein insertase YidC [Methylocystis sp.]
MTQHTKNWLLAIALSMIFIGIYDHFYLQPQVEKQHKLAEQAKREAQFPKIGAAPKTEPGAAAPSVLGATTVVKPREAALAESPRIAIDTRSVRGSIALKGARIDDLSLKNYRQTVAPNSPIIELLSPENTEQPYFVDSGFFSLQVDNAPVLPDSESLWTADRQKLTASEPVTLTFDNGHGLNFKRKISIDDEYMFKIEDSVENTGDKPVQIFPYSRVTRVGTPKGSGYAALHEGFIGVIGDQGTQEWKYDKVEKEPDPIKRTFRGTGGWVGFTDKYWGVVTAPDPAASIDVRYSASPLAQKVYDAQAAYVEPRTVEPGQTQTTLLHVFAGAKEVDLLDAYEKNDGLKGFDRLIDWGWFYFITRPMFRLIDYLYKILGNFGLAILAVTVIVKAAFLPIANASYKSMAKIKSIQPKIAALKEQYGDDKQKFNQEQMELYKREKVNPLGGCIPLLLQIPVFFSLYKVLVVTIEMRHAPFFGWIRDLSAPDPTNIFTAFGLIHWDPTKVALLGPYLVLGIWPMLMGVTMWLQMKMNPEPADEIQKTMFSWMPVIFTFTMGGFASGLVIYWTWNNLLSITQQWVIYKRAGQKFELWDNLRKTFFSKA